MAAPNSTRALPAAGKLCYGCNDLSAAFPHGGTALGIAAAIRVIPAEHTYQTTREEDGATGRVIRMGGSLHLLARMRQWDNDLINVAFQNTALSNSERVITWDNTGQGGEITNLEPLVLSPIRDGDPAILIYKAAPVMQLEVGIPTQATRFLELNLSFVALEDASGRFGQMGPLAELTL